ncbi:MAG: segregation/condensation protein A [Anaerolineae bacterium]|nr:segregation/condensation protein A [Anaerolineae bacterium]
MMATLHSPALEAYRVRLQVFEGPLQLLLRLIERQELEITKVSLALVTDQYMAHIATLRQVTAGDLAAFMVIAAKLLVIKSRSLLPQPEKETADEQEDLGEELAQQLLEYKRFKEVASELREIEERGQRVYPRLAPPPKIEPRLHPGEATLTDLLTAFVKALEAHPPLPEVDAVVAPTTVRIQDCMATIQSLLAKQGRVRFSTLMRRAHSRLEIIVTFLAMLEMIRRQVLRVTQDTPFGEIHLEARDPDPDADIPPLDLSEYGEKTASETSA